MEARRLCMFYKISLYDYFHFMIWHPNINVYHVMKANVRRGELETVLLNTAVNVI